MDGFKSQVDAFSAVVERLHAAALGDCDWLVAADSIRTYLDLDVANLLSVNPGMEITGGACSGLSDPDKETYLLDWSHRDELAVAAFAAKRGQARRFATALSLQNLGDDSAYRAWYRPTGLVHGGFLYLTTPNGDTAGLGLFNSHGRGVLSDDQLRASELIGNHLYGSLRTAELVRTLSQRAFDGEWLLRRWRMGLVRTDDQARVQSMQGNAEALIRAGAGGLRLSNGKLGVRDPNANQRLNRLIRSPDYGASFSGPSLALNSAETGFPLECIVLALGSPHTPTCPTTPLERDSDRLVVLRESGHPLAVDPHFLRQRLTLTPTEADVLSRLMLGYRVEAIADERGSTVETIRSYLRTLRRKLQCQSQGQLVHCGWQAVGFVPTDTRTDLA